MMSVVASVSGAAAVSLRPSTRGGSSRTAVAATAPRAASLAGRSPSVRAPGLRLAAPKNARLQAVAADIDFNQVGADMDGASPLEIMDHALATFGPDVAIAFSGAEDVALIEYAHLTGRPFRVFSLDTGRLNPETYRLFDRVEKHYGIKIEFTFPDADECKELVNTKGMFSFYEDGHEECCRIRKVRPLRKQLKTLRAWITGQRKDQSPGTRMNVPVCQVDPVFEGVDGGPGSLAKYNPLSNITSAEVWNFLRVMGVPTNELHECGYISIGCEPCTRPVLPNQLEREGRWWWEDAKAKECGLHSGNVKSAGTEAGEKAEVRDLWTSGPVEPISKAELAALLEGPRDKDTMVVLYAPWCQYSQGLEEDFTALAASMGGENLRFVKFQADIEREFAAEKFDLQTFPTLSFLPKNSTRAIKYPTDRRDVPTLTMWINTLASK